MWRKLYRWKWQHIAKRVKDHNGRDHKSCISRHSLEPGHKHVKRSEFSILSNNFNVNKRKQKIAESLLIKQLRRTLNIHNKSVPLKLFNSLCPFEMCYRFFYNLVSTKNFFMLHSNFLNFYFFLSFYLL